MKYYIFNDKKEVICCNGIEEYLEAKKKYGENVHVCYEMVGHIRVSTVLLPIDHSYTVGSKPVIFETCVFGGKYDQRIERYITIEEARAGHKKMVNRVVRSETLN